MSLYRCASVKPVRTWRSLTQLSSELPRIISRKRRRSCRCFAWDDTRTGPLLSVKQPVRPVTSVSRLGWVTGEVGPRWYALSGRVVRQGTLRFTPTTETVHRLENRWKDPPGTSFFDSPRLLDRSDTGQPGRSLLHFSHHCSPDGDQWGLKTTTESPPTSDESGWCPRSFRWRSSLKGVDVWFPRTSWTVPSPVRS